MKIFICVKKVSKSYKFYYYINNVPVEADQYYRSLYLLKVHGTHLFRHVSEKERSSFLINIFMTENTEIESQWK